jgi:hypothetical protein
VKPGGGTWRTDGVAGSPIRRLDGGRIEDRGSHPATDKPPSIVGTPRPQRSRLETGEASWGTAVAASVNTTGWGLLKQPDNQKPGKIRG